MDTLPHDLVKMEYERLSAELASLLKETNELARYAVVAGAAVFAYSLTAEIGTHTHSLLKALPFFITLLLGFRVYAIYRRIELISTYIENQIEKEIIKKDFQNLGWETHLNTNIREAKCLPKSFSQVATILFWGVLLSITLIIIFLQ
ncbi:MAG: hypothetical protein ABI091_13505 [Ferruginibacter sp.]